VAENQCIPNKKYYLKIDKNKIDQEWLQWPVHVSHLTGWFMRIR